MQGFRIFLMLAANRLNLGFRILPVLLDAALMRALNLGQLLLVNFLLVLGSFVRSQPNIGQLLAKHFAFLRNLNVVGVTHIVELACLGFNELLHFVRVAGRKVPELQFIAVLNQSPMIFHPDFVGAGVFDFR